jgi:hypothetical protein
MTEQDLIELGFERNDITAEESGYQNDWYYYTYDFVNNLSLISCDNEEAQIKGWYIEVFEAETIRFYTAEDVKKLIDIINKNKL